MAHHAVPTPRARVQSARKCSADLFCNDIRRKMNAAQQIAGRAPTLGEPVTCMLTTRGEPIAGAERVAGAVDAVSPVRTAAPGGPGRSTSGGE
jgi:hypothetical protein